MIISWAIFFYLITISTVINALINVNYDYENVIVMHFGKPFVITCNSTQNYEMPVSWSKDGFPMKFGDKHVLEDSNHTIKILEPVLDDVGVYICSVGPEHRTIHTHMAPHLEMLHKSLNLIEGDTLRLHCSAQGVPPPVLNWYMSGELLSPPESPEEVNVSRFRFLSDEKGNKHAILILEKVVPEDRATYACVASSIAGAANSTILVRVKDRYAALWPFLGIVVEVVVLCTLILVYEKRRSRTQDEDSEAEPVSAVTKSVQDHSGEVRQRK